MEYMKVLHLSLFVGQLDLTNLYYRCFLYFAITSSQSGLVKITFSCGGTKFVLWTSLLHPFPQILLFLLFLFDLCLEASTYIKHATKNLWKSINTFPLALSEYISHLSLDLKQSFQPVLVQHTELWTWDPKYSSKLPEPSSCRTSLLLIHLMLWRVFSWFLAIVFAAGLDFVVIAMDNSPSGLLLDSWWQLLSPGPHSISRVVCRLWAPILTRSG